MPNTFNISNLPDYQQDLRLGGVYWVFSENIENTLRLVVYSTPTKTEDPKPLVLTDAKVVGLIQDSHYEVPREASIAFLAAKNKGNLLPKLLNLPKLGDLEGKTIFVLFDAASTFSGKVKFQDILKSIKKVAEAKQCCLVLMPTGVYGRQDLELIKTSAPFLTGVSEIAQEIGRLFYRIMFWKSGDLITKDIEEIVKISGNRFKVLTEEEKLPVVEPQKALDPNLPPWMRESEAGKPAPIQISEAKKRNSGQPVPSFISEKRSSWESQRKAPKSDEVVSFHDELQKEAALSAPPPEEESIREKIEEQEKQFNQAEPVLEEKPVPQAQPPKPEKKASRWNPFSWFGRKRGHKEEKKEEKESSPSAEAREKAPENGSTFDLPASYQKTEQERPLFSESRPEAPKPEPEPPPAPQPVRSEPPRRTEEASKPISATPKEEAAPVRAPEPPVQEAAKEPEPLPEKAPEKAQEEKKRGGFFGWFVSAEDIQTSPAVIKEKAPEEKIGEEKKPASKAQPVPEPPPAKEPPKEPEPAPAPEAPKAAAFSAAREEPKAASIPERPVPPQPEAPSFREVPPREEPRTAPQPDPASPYARETPRADSYVRQSSSFAQDPRYGNAGSQGFSPHNQGPDIHAAAEPPYSSAPAFNGGTMNDAIETITFRDQNETFGSLMLKESGAGEELGMKYLGNNQEVYVQGLQSNAATLIFSLDDFASCEDLATMIYSLRRKRGNFLKIFVFENISQIKWHQEKLLFQAGATMVFKKEAPLSYRLAVIESMKFDEFRRPLPKNLEEMLWAYRIVNRSGIF